MKKKKTYLKICQTIFNDQIFKYLEIEILYKTN